jgi:hypothetical protein
VKRLTDQDFIDAANALNTEVAVIRAVAEVEARGAGFIADGRPKILFEGHWFRKLTNRRYDATHPHLSKEYPASRQYYKLDQWKRMDEAMTLNRIAALQSASFGVFQIMGFNFKECGFASVEEFYTAMCESEGRQLLAFVAFVKSKKLDRHLRAKNWAAFAEGYNGADFRTNKYDSKMADAYDRFKR